MSLCERISFHARLTSSRRKYTCRTQVTQLIWHERIETTHPRAKELSKIADNVVQLAKKVCMHDQLVYRCFVP